MWEIQTDHKTVTYGQLSFYHYSNLCSHGRMIIMEQFSKSKPNSLKI